MQHNHRTHAAQSGFTLVELSIVLVIIGLIIGGVLTGQQIIQNARVTSAVNGVQAYQAQFQTYAQNYGALPGDDSKAFDRFPNNVTNDQVGSGDGKIDENEISFVWIHLQAAGLVKSSAAAAPPNPFSGTYGFHNGAFGVFTTTTLCLDKIPAYAAQVIDSKLDDGVGNTGAARAIEYVDGADVTAIATPLATYSDDKTFTMCVRM